VVIHINRSHERFEAFRKNLNDIIDRYADNGVFIIIDKEGKIVNADAPRPSSDEITGLLEGLLKK